MAGVAAAYFLRKFGISSLILEARDRIGGRLWTSTRWPDAPFDLGGAWITETPINPLTPLAKAFNIQTQFTDFLSFTMFRPNGVQLTQAQVATGLGLYGRVLAQVNADRALLRARGFPDQPLSTDVNNVVAALRLAPDDLALLNALIEVNRRSTFTSELSDLSLYYYDQDQNVFPGIQNAFPKGFVQLVRALAADQQILYGQVVKQVLYGAQGVTVVTNQGRFSAKYAIVTVPLGVLRSGNIEFAPALPAWKQGAINRLRMGNYNKLVLRFPRAFWVPPAPAPQPNFLLRIAPKVGDYIAWFNAVGLIGKPILSAFAFGDMATKTEAMTDAEVVNTLMTILRQWYGPRGIQVPDPVDFQRSRWGTDPFSLGSFSHIPVGSSGADYDLMALPVPYAANLPASANRLLFAGEATHRQHPESVWGAYESGMREAVRVQALR